MDVVHVGRQWQHALSPCSRGMSAHLENNEGLVYWLQPAGGPPADQVPAIKVGGQFYGLSMRMMKAVWRHIRLRKGFCNVERGNYGSHKLRIPILLLQEKMRTQSLFNVSHPYAHSLTAHSLTALTAYHI